MKNRIYYLLLIFSSASIASCNTEATVKEEAKTLGQIEWEKSAEPLHPGKPGEVPFWNTYSERFIYAPAFNYGKIEGAEKYRFKIFSHKDSSTYSFEDEVPYAPLSSVWTSVPVGNFDLKVSGISADGENLGTAGEGTYFRAAPFNGPYHEPVIPYDSSGRLALDKAMHKEYVNYWLVHKTYDPGYWIYKYPAKVYGSIVVGAVLHARLNKETKEAERSLELARIVADYLLKIRFEEGTPLEYFPPSYYGERIINNSSSHMKLTNYLTIAAAESGHAFLDIYDYTGDEKYLNAAKKIAQTYVNTQLDNGTWYMYTNTETGKPNADNLTIPTAIINYFDRLAVNYDVDGLEQAGNSAFEWIMENPVKTFDWQAQYEDVKAYAPYERLSREQVCDLAIYLFKNFGDQQEYVKLAEELIRFAEDQFITWEQMEDLVVYKGQTFRPAPDTIKTEPGWYSRNWMLPVVHEQYGFWMPSARNTGLMIETYWHAYETTGNEIYLQKAISIANNFTRVQKEHNGDYPTMFTKYPMNFWINNSIYPAKVMLEFKENLKRLNKEEN